MTKEDVTENWVDVSNAKVKAIAGLYELGCFKRWPRHTSNKIIVARWLATWNMIEGNVGVKCRLAIRGFKDKFQDLDTYVGNCQQVWSKVGQRNCSTTPRIYVVQFRR